MPSGSKSSSVSLYDRRFSRYRQSKFRASDNRGFSWRTSQNVQNGSWVVAYALRVEIELRFALRSTVSEIMAIKVSANWPLSKTITSLERKHGIHTICILFPLIWAMHLDHYLKPPGTVLEILSSTGPKTPFKGHKKAKKGRIKKKKKKDGHIGPYNVPVKL